MKGTDIRIGLGLFLVVAGVFCVLAVKNGAKDDLLMSFTDVGNKVLNFQFLIGALAFWLISPYLTATEQIAIGTVLAFGSATT